MKKVITYCNRCGKEFDTTDEACGFYVRQKIGYGSAYDGEWLTLDLCTECLDGFIDSCRIDPTASDDPENLIREPDAPRRVMYCDPCQIPMEFHNE